MTVLIVWVLIVLIALLSGCISENDKYMRQASGRASQEEIAKKWGAPAEQRSLSTGETVWSYRLKRYSPVENRAVCEGYELKFDARGILQDWNRFYCDDSQLSDARPLDRIPTSLNL